MEMRRLGRAGCCFAGAERCVDRISRQLLAFLLALLVAGGAGFVAGRADVRARFAAGTLAVFALLADGTILARCAIGARAVAVAAGAHGMHAVVRAGRGGGFDLDLVFARVADGDGEGFGGVADDLELGFVREDADRADLGFGDVTEAADQRQDPFRIGIALAADIETEPRAIAFRCGEAAFGAAARGGAFVEGGRAVLLLEALRVAHAAIVGHVFRLGQFGAQESDEGGGELFGGGVGGELANDVLVFFRRRSGQRGMIQQALAILLADFLRGGRAAPGGFDVGGGEHLFRAAALGVRDEKDGRAFLARAACAA